MNVSEWRDFESSIETFQTRVKGSAKNSDSIRFLVGVNETHPLFDGR